MSAALLVAVLRDLRRSETLSASQRSDVICAARAERLLANLAHRVGGLTLSTTVSSMLDAAIADAEVGRAQALWEAEMARRALAPLDV